ncbi:MULTISPECIES: bacillithiol system redox-active protein YtxJ [Arcicella]|uniref:Bacillithiol system redox-active protein YtxJ n=1 Tax=Arcicella lustrica TaxID=2984196 RepID=A0ABU5SDW5_9BACT|nr:bacillithiol system redox-active protein YtxJ [Arcicella sp. DC25W]MEA5425473.1 bacillithiol system redox-active protein YtxJ [Arcicella sp. DC25W]|eukprot:Opistho-1_new@16083
MNWNQLTDLSQLEAIKEESKQQPILILKHSTTCSISSTALNRLERNWKQESVGELKPYYLDLLKFRPISTEIANTFDVEHQSPQVLVIQNGECIYDASHFDISFAELAEKVA